MAKAVPLDLMVQKGERGWYSTDTPPLGWIRRGRSHQTGTSNSVLKHRRSPNSRYRLPPNSFTVDSLLFQLPCFCSYRCCQPTFACVIPNVIDSAAVERNPESASSSYTVPPASSPAICPSPCASPDSNMRSLISWNAFPAMFTKLNFLFISPDIPAA